MYELFNIRFVLRCSFLVVSFVPKTSSFSGCWKTMYNIYPNEINLIYLYSTMYQQYHMWIWGLYENIFAIAISCIIQKNSIRHQKHIFQSYCKVFIVAHLVFTYYLVCLLTYATLKKSMIFKLLTSLQQFFAWCSYLSTFIFCHINISSYSYVCVCSICS